MPEITLLPKKRMVKSRTVLFNATLAFILPVMKYYGAEVPLEILAPAVTVLNILLRLDTTGPVGG